MSEQAANVIIIYTCPPYMYSKLYIHLLTRQVFRTKSATEEYYENASAYNQAFRFMVGQGHCPMISTYGPSHSKAVGPVDPSF